MLAIGYSVLANELGHKNSPMIIDRVALRIAQQLSGSRSDKPTFVQPCHAKNANISIIRSYWGLLLRNTDVCSKRRCHPRNSALRAFLAQNDKQCVDHKTERINKRIYPTN
jgi:hypothetical protein